MIQSLPSNEQNGQIRNDGVESEACNSFLKDRGSSLNQFGFMTSSIPQCLNSVKEELEKIQQYHCNRKGLVTDDREEKRVLIPIQCL